jgi:hypothetical protein
VSFVLAFFVRDQYLGVKTSIQVSQVESKSNDLSQRGLPWLQNHPGLSMQVRFVQSLHDQPFKKATNRPGAGLYGAFSVPHNVIQPFTIKQSWSD